MPAPQRHREQATRASAQQAALSEKAQVVGIVSRLMGEQAQMLKEVVGEYEQCGVALGQAHIEIEVRERALREVERGIRRALGARTLQGVRTALNDALISARQR